MAHKKYNVDRPDQPNDIGRGSPSSDRTITPATRARSSSSSSTSSSSSSDTIKQSNRINKISEEERSRQWTKENDITTRAHDALDTDNNEVFLTHGKRSFCVPGNPSKDYTRTFRTLAEYEEWHTPIAEKVDAGSKDVMNASWADNGFWRCRRRRGIAKAVVEGDLYIVGVVYATQTHMDYAPSAENLYKSLCSFPLPFANGPIETNNHSTTPMPHNKNLRPDPLPPFSARRFFHVPNLLLPPPPLPSQQPPPALLPPPPAPQQPPSSTPTSTAPLPTPAPHTPARPSALRLSPEALARVQKWEKDVEMQNLDARTRRSHVEEARTPPTKTPSPPAGEGLENRMRCACLECRGGGEGGSRSEEEGGLGGGDDGGERIEQQRRERYDRSREMTSRTQMEEEEWYKERREEHSQVLEEEEEEEEGGSLQRGARQGEAGVFRRMRDVGDNSFGMRVEGG
ncbi:MAG: hypothetical protein Q9184_002950 [Pyrenodesmia sp. 2 TL-2023]